MVAIGMLDYAIVYGLMCAPLLVFTQQALRPKAAQQHSLLHDAVTVQLEITLAGDTT
jgi:hypothetical protein